MTWSCNNEKFCKTWLSPTHICLIATEEHDGHEPNGGGLSKENKTYVVQICLVAC